MPEPPGRPPPEDATLIARSLHDPETFAALYDRHAPALHRYAARRLGPEAADDIVSGTFLDAFRRRHRYDPAVPDARPWLYGIAANLIGKHTRSEVRMLRAYARTGADPILTRTTEADDADSRLSSVAVRRELAQALAALSPGDRDVLLMVAWADLSHTEVATALRIPPGTVRSRLHRARTRIRAALGGYDPTSVREESVP